MPQVMRNSQSEGSDSPLLRPTMNAHLQVAVGFQRSVDESRRANAGSCGRHHALSLARMTV